jgi:hypothetical protein
MKSMNDLIYAYLLEHGGKLTNQQIAEHFYKMGGIEDDLADRIVAPVLEGDPRFSRDGSSWRALKLESVEDLSLWDAPYVLFAVEEFDTAADKLKDVMGLIDQYASFVLCRQGDAVKTPPVTELMRESGQYIFLPYDAKALSRLRRLYRMYSPLRLEMKTLSLRRLLSHFYPDKNYKTWEDIIRDFSIVNFESSNPASKTKSMLHVFTHLLERASKQGVARACELIEISNRIEPSINFSRYGFGRDFLRELPEKPGVYLFHNREGQVIYVGKTKNLRTRVGSYFRYSGEGEEKRELILQHLYSIDHRVLGSDLEAVIEEYRLIERHRPVLNKRMKIPERKSEIPECVILLPSALEQCLKLYFLTAGTPLLEVEYRPGVDLSEPLRRVREKRDYCFDPLKIIAVHYLKRYEAYINVVSLDLYASDEDLVKALKRHWENRKNIGLEKVTFM